MDHFEFAENAVTGITDIDEQHRELIHRFNVYADSVADDQDAESCLQMLAYLAEYASYHFGFEERMMQRYGYPDLQIHAESHAQVSEKLKKIVLMANEQGAMTEEVASAVHGIVDDLYRHHMKKHDGPLAEYLRWHGIP